MEKTDIIVRLPMNKAKTHCIHAFIDPRTLSATTFDKDTTFGASKFRCLRLHTFKPEKLNNKLVENRN